MDYRFSQCCGVVFTGGEGADFQQLVSELKARLGLRVSFDQACPEMVMEDGKDGCGLVFLIGRKVSRSKLEGQQVAGWSPEKGKINRVTGKSIGKDPSKHGFGFGSLQEVTNRRDPLKRVAWIRFVLQVQENGRSGWLCFLDRWNNLLGSHKCLEQTGYVW
ncbi:hypothetical protein LXL04_004946 [Taraxacum kok-saghyz]